MAVSLAKITRTLTLLEKALRIPWGSAPGLRQCEQWTVADGEMAAARAVHDYYQAGGEAPAEITMVAQLVALYGGQVALAAGEGVTLLVPDGVPERISQIAIAAGFLQHREQDRPYRAMSWEASK